MSMPMTLGARPHPVVVVPAERGAVRGIATYTGSVAAFNDEDVYPRVTGRIVVGQAYALLRRADFSCEVVGPSADSILVSRLPSLIWSDLGTPRRVVDVLRRTSIQPPWLGKVERIPDMEDVR